MENKIFYLRKATATDSIIELRVVTDAFTKDINTLRKHIKELNETSNKIINEIKYGTP